MEIPRETTSLTYIDSKAEVVIVMASIEAQDIKTWVFPSPAVPVTDTPEGGRLCTFWSNWSILEDLYVTNALHYGSSL